MKEEVDHGAEAVRDSGNATLLSFNVLYLIPESRTAKARAMDTLAIA